MANLKLSHIYKVYENGHKAVNDFCIDIEDKEFIVFVGPSGCGKSTTLRMIAGLETITAGDLFIGDTLVNDMEPKDRDIAMVFQNYALYPHMTVYENMAFGLRNRKVPEAEIKEKVLEAARILDIEDYLQRKPKAMSGGQRQRVALGRAIVRHPKVFLLDEPLSNLDAKLRAQMRTEITKLHKKLGTTFIYVTHDQVEAMTMGTRIVVMKLGYVQQIDTPMNLYNKPYNKFVAGFIGSPQMNFFNVKLNRSGDKVDVLFAEGSKITIPYETVAKVDDKYLHGDVEVILGIRPEHITISKEETGLKCTVNVVERLGNESLIYGVLSGQAEGESLATENQIIVKTIEDVEKVSGDVVNLHIDLNKIHLFDAQSEITILEDIPQTTTFPAKVNGDKIEFLGATAVLPPALLEAVNGRNYLLIDIPPSAIVPGKDFTLPVSKIEEVANKRLAYLKFDNRYLFAFVGEEVKEGAKYSFSLLNDKLVIRDGEEIILQAISPKEELIGKFEKFDNRKTKNLEFFYNINGVKISAPQVNGYKINAVEGNNCYRRNYRYVFDRSAIQLVEASENAIHATVLEVLDYGNINYARLDVDGQKILVEVEKGFDQKEANFLVSGEAIEIFSLDIDMRIC